MNRKPTRPFVILALALVCLLVIGLIVVGLLVTNATRIIASPSQTATFTPIPYTADMSPTALPVFTPTPVISPTPTLTPPPYSGCSWQWARQDVPDVIVIALQALIDADMGFVEVRAEAYGENCIDTATNQVNYFAAMTTDIYLTAPGGDIDRLDALGGFVAAVYQTLVNLPADSLPARLGYLDITLTFDGQTRRLRTTFAGVQAALDEGLRGARLLAALGGLR